MRGISAVQFIYKVLGEWTLELVRNDKLLSERPLESWIKKFNEFLVDRQSPSNEEEK